MIVQEQLMGQSGQAKKKMRGGAPMKEFRLAEEGKQIRDHIYDVVKDGTSANFFNYPTG